MRLEIESNPSAFVENVVADAATENQAFQSKEALRDGIKSAQSGDRAQARVALFRAAELDPKSESAWLWLASISEYPEELLVFLNNVLDINPLNARATEWMAATKSLLAKTFVQQGIDAVQENRSDFAAQCFNQALEHDQNNPLAWLWMASLADSNEGKISYLEKVLELEPDNEDALSAFKSAKDGINQNLLDEARSAAVAGRKSDSNELLTAFIAENPESEEGWVLRSHLADSFDEKIAAFEKVLSINSENLTARAGLDSLNAIMQTVAPKAEEVKVEVPELTENTSLALDAERQYESEFVHDKSPTQDLVFPEVAAEMQPNPVNNEDQSETVLRQDLVFFDSPETGAEEMDAAPAHLDAPAEDWLMNTQVLKFELPELNGTSNGSVETVDPVVNSFDFSVVSNSNEFELSESEEDDSLYDELSFQSETPISPGDVPMPPSSPFDSYVSTPEEYPVDSVDAGPTFEPKLEEYSDTDDFSGSENLSFEPVVEEVVEAHSPFEHSIPMPPVEFAVVDSFSKPTGFETTIVRQENTSHSSPVLSLCPYCSAENPAQAFACGTCLAMLTLSDLEMLLANQHAERGVLRDAVLRIEAERDSRPLTENELTTLGIGHLNLRNFETGYQFLHEASQLNPNNVMLGSQVNALLIRLDEIKRQDEVHDAMPKGKKILVVDDSATVRKLIAGKLEKCGHDVHCAGDGVEAIEKLETLMPDLILLDITMPRMDGYQVCKLIRSNNAIKDVPVIMISGKDGFFDKVRGRMAGTTGYITKPFGPETLMKAVETYLKGEE